MKPLPSMLLVILAVLAEAGSAQEPVAGRVQVEAFGSMSEPLDAGWTVTTDNDLFAPKNNDRDYTGGFALTISGYRAAINPFSVNRALTWIDRKLGRRGEADLQSQLVSHSMQFGLLVFTPDDIRRPEPLPGERPYANLLFLGNTQLTVDARLRRAFRTSLTFGILGSAAGESAQKIIHRALGAVAPEGFRHQVSEGGELTARYSFAAQTLLRSRRGNGRKSGLDIKYEVSGSLGYLTEIGVKVAARWGHALSPWWQFAPADGNYVAAPVALPEPADRSGGRESYLWIAAALRLIVFDAFLEGQIRDSDVRLGHRDLERLIAEGSIGWTTTLSPRLELTYALHYESREVRRGPGGRDIRWGDLSLTRHF